MDILSHCLAGVAVGTVIAAFQNKNIHSASSTIISGAMGGFTPDLDAISLWRGFDAAIGKSFYLKHSGQEIYFEKFWYSHHGFIHSLLAALLISYFFFRIVRFVKWKDNSQGNGFPFALAFFAGYVLHLLGDMITPDTFWGGIAFLFPSKNYIGGFGQVWWWNNYDLFLIINTCCIINLILLRFHQKFVKHIITFVFLLSSFAFIYQVNTRNFDFNSKTHNSAQKEKKSLEIQAEILPTPIYQFMTAADRYIPFGY